MAQTKIKRARKRQLGQFYTPARCARKLVAELDLTISSVVLEPSAGAGAFVLPLVERFMELHHGSQSLRLEKTLRDNLHAVEIDPAAKTAMLVAITRRWGRLPRQHRLTRGDFFATDFDTTFDVIIGNPPFGGTIRPALQDKLDARYGQRDGFKIKKETYSFFIVRAVEMLRPAGRLRFICSDTFLTIPTMKGLREFLLNRGRTAVTRIDGQFAETDQPMVLLDYQHTGQTEEVEIDGQPLRRETINLTGNRSWQINESLGRLFAGPKLGDVMVASSGMTVGRNELFVRDIVDGAVLEPYDFRFRQEPITLRRELERARLGYLSQAVRARIMRQEELGETRRVVEAIPLAATRRVPLPHPDYCFYNKATRDIVFSQPKHAIFWRDDGDAVITFKKSGNWYLHGVGGQPYFKREGLSWQLIAPSLNARYLPPGYILDSGAPCAFLRDGIDRDELWFVLGWCLTPLCTRILKDVLNHTRNIQSKDVERLPYPFWVAPADKGKAIARCRDLVVAARSCGTQYRRDHPEIVALTECYRVH